ncbi:lipocalin family protein [Luteibacter anthropi]|uniref:lipocalin family protein n=1 Tax=Luteibacter anthropi TaxID=564369 RepID=UPI00218ADC03|nr:lipocalin family protein [Luteibacter anthropi]
MNILPLHLARTCLMLCPLAACSTQPPVPRTSSVDVARYMGDWYVIASIPSRFEKGAFNAVESYRLAADGTIQTTFRYRKEKADGDLKTMHATGFAHPGERNAVWGMQFIWPIKAQYVIAWLDPGYRFVIVARDKRDYVWIMAHEPAISGADYAALAGRVAAMGYDVSQLRKVPQQWPEAAPR